MEPPALLLYSRQGCCLCEGLEERLRALPLPVPLVVIDVDGDPELQARYGLEVPVLEVRSAEGRRRPLPRVSPRLAGDGLADWLQRNGFPAQSV
jgi:hypothetical protein